MNGFLFMNGCLTVCAYTRRLHALQDSAVVHCWDLPPHTFGGAYAQFMGARGFRADDRPVVR